MNDMEDINKRKQRIEDIKLILNQLLEKADLIGSLICIYEYNDDIDSKGIYHSCAGNMMKHYGMLEFVKQSLDNKMRYGEYDYSGD